MPQVTVRGRGIPAVLLRPGETLLFGRDPQALLAPGRVPGRTVLTVPGCASHVSRVVGELAVGDERAVLTWLGGGAAQLAGVFDAPGGARRVSMSRGMSVPLDDGENQLALLLGGRDGGGELVDLLLDIEVSSAPVDRPGTPGGPGDTEAEPSLDRGGREWFVALALCEPWLVGDDDYPRPPSNREIFERIRGWHGYAWNLHRPQRVDEAIRLIAAVAFGKRDDPFRSDLAGRRQNVRFAVARRAAELRLVTPDDLAEVEARSRKRPPERPRPGATDSP